MNDEQFIKLFKYMEKRFNAVDQKFEENDVRFDQVMSVLYDVLKQNEIDEQERLAQNRQLDRHERWINSVAKKVGLKLAA